MKILQTKLLLLASALFIVTSCDCIKKFQKVEKEVKAEVRELGANDEMMESTLVAEGDMPAEHQEVAAASVEENPAAEIPSAPVVLAHDATTVPAEVAHHEEAK